jgi:hypothetical protein
MSTAPTARLPRRPPLRVLAWVALVLVSVVAGLAHAGPASAASTTLFGFNDWNDASNYYLQPQLGMPVRRMILGWNEVQPTQGAWDWSGSDAVYSSLLANGLRPLIVIQSAPCWANATLPCSDAANGALPPDSAHLGDWATFISRLAQRYPAAVGIEIWNEENLTYEWLPYPDPVAYTAVLKAADDAVKAVAPNMPVISGGLFVSGQSGPDGMADGAFLGGMYSAGAKGHFDGIGIHPYPIAGGWDGTPIRVDTSIVEQSLDTLRTARDAAGDSSTPLWVTEIGVSTQSLVGSAPATDETDQAAELLWMLSRLCSSTG